MVYIIICNIRLVPWNGMAWIWAKLLIATLCKYKSFIIFFMDDKKEGGDEIFVRIRKWWYFLKGGRWELARRPNRKPLCESLRPLISLRSVRSSRCMEPLEGSYRSPKDKTGHFGRLLMLLEEWAARPRYKLINVVPNCETLFVPSSPLIWSSLIIRFIFFSY